ncbi:MAG: single-stranded-DNA-specific exonuclease RecJ, partial [Pseudanabaenaceae cyanobacterium]
MSLPEQRWQIAPVGGAALATALGISPFLAGILWGRGWQTVESARAFLIGEEALPDPHTVFPDLGRSVARLTRAIERQEAIAICGDYDADGMTSTALLLRTLRAVGGQADYEIPSRAQEGYGINERMVRSLHGRGVSLILTVDNGIAAHGPLAQARDLGIDVIVTDHHDLPPVLPPALAILNPKMLPATSPYATIAGVGVAYLLGRSLAARLGKLAALEPLLWELFALGTIADLAALVGINRHLTRRGLQRLGRSGIPGVRALQQVAGLAPTSQDLKPEAVGFALGPRINAVGRIGDPAIAIDLLTTDDEGIALERAYQCEQINQKRQQLCQEIEAQAIAQVENALASGEIDFKRDRVLVLMQPDWHQGVIGIVASRLVERYGAPVFLATAAPGDQLRGSARGIPEFHVFAALESAKSLLLHHGGHPAAGGFSLAADRWPAFRTALQQFAQTHLQPEWIRPRVEIDALVDITDLSLALWEDTEKLQPCGMGNRPPVLASTHVRVLAQKAFGKNQEHLRLTLARGPKTIEALAWRGGHLLPVPPVVDIAYSLNRKLDQGEPYLELEVKGLRQPCPPLVYRCPPPHPPSPVLPWQPGEPLPEPIVVYGGELSPLPLDFLAGQTVVGDRPKGPIGTLILA